MKKSASRKGEAMYENPEKKKVYMKKMPPAKERHLHGH